MYEYVNNFIGKDTKVVLVREDIDKKKRERKPATRLSVFSDDAAAKKRKPAVTNGAASASASASVAAKKKRTRA